MDIFRKVIVTIANMMLEDGFLSICKIEKYRTSYIVFLLGGIVAASVLFRSITIKVANVVNES